METGDTTKPEAKPRLFREGEVSPYKLLLTILIRENYSEVDQPPKSSEIRVNSALFLFRLMNTPDMTLNELAAELIDPANDIPCDTVRRFNRVISTLDDENACFLYELFHSIIELSEPGQVIILKKRISKSSPFGQFLRLILFHLHKMSYPQTLHLYRELIRYVKARNGVPIIKVEVRPAVPINPRRIPKPAVRDRPCPRSAKNRASRSSKSTTAEDDDGIGTIINPLAEMEIGAEVTIKGEDIQLPPERISPPKRGLDVFQKILNERIERGESGLMPFLYNQYLYEHRLHAGTLTTDQDMAFNIWECERQEKVMAAKATAMELRGNWRRVDSAVTAMEFPMEMSSDEDVEGIVQQVVKKRSSTRKSPRYSQPEVENACPPNFCVVDGSEEMYFQAQETSSILDDLPVPARTRSKVKQAKEQEMQMSSVGQSPVIQMRQRLMRDPEIESEYGSQRWRDLREWNKKLVLRTMRKIALDLTNVGGSRSTPRDVSRLLAALKHCPNASEYMAQLEYLEYLNSLQLKDVTRCTEALRTSYDVRANATDGNTGTPYAAYNFAVFYNFMGYRKDATLFLEEAFQAGHSAGDVTCLHHCLNLWSNFQDLPYREIVAMDVKEMAEDLLDLNARNLVISTIEAHVKNGMYIDDILEVLACTSNKQDVVESEAYFLEAMMTYYSIYGWQRLCIKTALLILQSNHNWPKRTYCLALCQYAQIKLLSGSISLAQFMMDHGRTLFGCLATPEGTLFGAQDALFLATFAYLGNKPVSDAALGSIASFDKREHIYWMAYTQMIYNNYEAAEKLIKQLRCLLEGKESIAVQDLKLRCYLLDAELNCLCECPTQALQPLFDALKLAELINADFYIASCHINISAIQNYLGLTTSAVKAMNDGLESITRGGCAYLRGRVNLLNIKLRLNVLRQSKDSAKPTAPTDGTESKKRKLKYNEKLTGRSEFDRMLGVLEDTKKIYQKWDNQYRMKEILGVKAAVFEVFGKPGKIISVQQQLGRLESQLMWSAKTCIV